jgi:hypothetical protein
MLPRTRTGFGRAGSFAPLLVLILVVSLFLPSAAGFAAQEDSEAKRLQQKAQNAFIKGDYAEATALDLAIAQKHPASAERRYAVQMLGTLYQDHVVDLRKAIQWNREFLEKYADFRQAPVYQQKLAFLEKLLNQEAEYKAYQAIRTAQDSDEVLVKKYEAFLREHPDFSLKDKIESELGYAYARLDERKKSALAFQAAASQGQAKAASSEMAEYKAEHRYWQMRTTWAWVAWAVLGVLWAAALWMNPWKQLTWSSVRRFLLWPVLWLVVTGASMPLFYSRETTGYPIVIPAITIYIAIALNLIFLLWFMLLLHGKSWQSRPLARRWLSPVLALLMTASVFYLWVAYQPNGPFIVDACVVKWSYWRGEWREWVARQQSRGQSAKEQDKPAAALPANSRGSQEGLNQGR